MDYTPEELLERGQPLLSAGQPHAAIPFIEKILASDASNAPALDLLGEAFFETGDHDKALRCFEASAKLAPEEVGTKWMFLGQLAHGHEALQHYERGVALLEREAAQDVLRRQQLAAAHVTIAELFMADLCMEPDAEARCEAACAEARRLDPESLEAMQTTASMRVSQCRADEAKEIMVRIAAKLQASDDDHSYDFRLGAARLLVELDEAALAQTLLERLIQEDDEIAEVWMLLGLVHKASDADAARECYERALELLNQFSELDEEFQAMAGRVQELLMEVGDEDGAAQAEMQERRPTAPKSKRKRR